MINLADSARTGSWGMLLIESIMCRKFFACGSDMWRRKMNQVVESKMTGITCNVNDRQYYGERAM